MYTTLKVQPRVVNGYTYYRVNIPSKISKELGLKKGDKLEVNIIGIVDPSKKEESLNA